MGQELLLAAVGAADGAPVEGPLGGVGREVIGRTAAVIEVAEVASDIVSALHVVRVVIS